MSVDITRLSDGVDGIFIRNARFNTTLISFNFYMPLDKDRVAQYALLPFVMTTCSNKYPDFTKLNYKLDKLYGAKLEASAEKVGDLQLLKMTVSVIDDKYTLDGEELCAQACELLMSLIFEPKAEDGAFFEEDLKREKRKAIEHIRGEMNEKRIYAKKRLIEEMYKNSPYGVSKCGTEKQVSEITGKSLYKAWRELISSAYVRVNVIGNSLPVGLFESITERFSDIKRENITDCFNITPTRKAVKVKEITENMDISQGKLVMGFSSRMYGDDIKTAPMLVMCDIFGGGPYSRLFTNVREKMSLCYYCLASAVRVKGLITVDSGVEKQNADKAKEEILKQLEAVKKGEFSDFEFESSIKSITDSLKTYDDSQSSLDLWYSLRISSEKTVSPQEMSELVSKVERKQITDVANGVFLHTVYRLMPEGA